jgi:hypothetical protein
LTVICRLCERSRPGSDLDRGGHSGDEAHALRHPIDIDAYRNALREPHPGKDPVDQGHPFAARPSVGDSDGAGDAVDMSGERPIVAHQLDRCRIAFLDRFQAGFLEIAVDPIGIGVDDRDDVDADGCVVAEPDQRRLVT